MHFFKSYAEFRIMNLYLYTWNRVFYSNGCVNYRICSLKKKLVWDERFIRRLTAISRSDNFWLYSTVRMCFSSSMLTLPSEFTSAFSKNFSQAASHLTNLSAIVVFLQIFVSNILETQKFFLLSIHLNVFLFVSG